MSEPCVLGIGKAVNETAKALCVRLDDTPNEDLWIPKSQLHDDSEVYKDGHTGEVVVTAWWARERGLT